MPTDPNILDDNASQRRRLEALVSRLTDDDRDVGNSWTIAASLAHLAFWDRRAALLLRRWERKGPQPDEPDVDLLNEALLPGAPTGRARQESLQWLRRSRRMRL
ncbi:MAG: hypothetical protein FJ312_01785 [SAR202 cluster bacterium]|nr:hypothetical protein [SAR202 cluster bacterium]